MTRTRRIPKGWRILVATLASLPTLVWAQSGRVTGVVTDSARKPIPDAQVTLAGLRATTTTNVQGRYTLTNVPSGTYTVRAQHIGHRAAEQPVTVTGGQDVTADFALSEAAVTLGGIVISASRRVEKVTDAPATISRIESTEIVNTVGNSFAPALKHIKGIDYVQVGITSVAINARGFNSSFNNRMLMMEDGRIAVLPENGLPAGAFTTIPKLDLAGVEVLIGPGSALYGPDASNGVLTLQTKDPRQYPGTSVEVSMGTHAYRDIQFRHAGVNGDFGYKFSGEYQAANDFSNSLVYASGAARIPERPVDWNVDVIRGEGALVWYKDVNRVEFSTGASQSNSVGQTNVGRNQLIDWQYRHLQAKWTAPNWYANVYRTQSLSGDTYAINRFTTNRPLFPASISDDSVKRLSDFPADGRLMAAELQNNFTLGAINGTRIVSGVQWRRDQVSSKREWLDDRVTGKDLELQQVGVYGQTETPLGAMFRVILAARYDKHDDYDAQFSPKAGLLWTPVPDQTWRITYNQAFKSPTTLQTHFSIPDFVRLPTGLGGFGVFGNSKGYTVRNAAGTIRATYIPLEPEKNTTWELGYKAILGSKLYVDAAVYRSDYESFLSPLITISNHLLTPAQGGPTFAHDSEGNRVVSPNGPQAVLTYLNLGKAKLQGSDAGFRYLFNDAVAASGTFSWTKLDRVDRKPTDPPQIAEATSLNTTPVKWNAGFDFNDAEFNLLGSITLRHVTGYNFRSGINAGIIPTFETLDVMVGKRLPSLNAQVNVSLQNIAGCRGGFYELFQGDASPGHFTKKRSCSIAKKHYEMINMPEIGTVLFVGIRYDR